MSLKSKANLPWLSNSLILGTLPSLGAVTSINGQCQPGETVATYAVPYSNLTGFRIDVDGDGTDDFEIQDSLALSPDKIS